MLLHLAGIALAVCIVLILVRYVVEWIHYGHLPGVARRFPLVGHLPAMFATRDRMFDFISDGHKRHGYPDVMYMSYAGQARFFLFSERDIQHILKDNYENYQAGTGERAEMLHELTGDGIFTSDGPHWLIQRKLASREFSASRFKDYMSEVFCRNALKLTQIIEDSIDNKDGVVDLHNLFFKLTMDAFGEIGFGVKIGGLDGKENPFSYAFDWCQTHCIDRGMKYPHWKLMRALNIGPEAEFKKRVDVLDKYVYNLIDEVQGSSNKDRDDLLSRLLPVAKNDDGTYDRKLIRDMVLNLFVAGRDTTAAGMSWTMYELMLNPDILDQARTECFELMHDGLATFESVADCHYLHACLSEGQRLHPSVAIDPKYVAANDKLPSGLQVKAGQTVIYFNYGLGRSQKLWGPDAEEFKPNRFLDAKTRKHQSANPYKFPAFQAGARLCLGVDMAYLEMKIVLSTLLRKFDFTLVNPEEVHYKPGLVQAMLHGMRVKCKRRATA